MLKSEQIPWLFSALRLNPRPAETPAAAAAPAEAAEGEGK